METKNRNNKKADLDNNIINTLFKKQCMLYPWYGIDKIINMIDFGCDINKLYDGIPLGHYLILSIFLKKDEDIIKNWYLVSNIFEKLILKKYDLSIKNKKKIMFFINIDNRLMTSKKELIDNADFSMTVFGNLNLLDFVMLAKTYIKKLYKYGSYGHSEYLEMKEYITDLYDFLYDNI